jgi:hypothetical protein
VAIWQGALREPPSKKRSQMISIDPDVLTYNDELGFSFETFAVTGNFEPAVVAAALDAAADRFMLVDEAGTMHPDFASMESAGVISAASYVSDAEVTERGVEVYIDCQGGIEDPVGVALRHALAGVLEDVVSDARVVAVGPEE